MENTNSLRSVPSQGDTAPWFIIASILLAFFLVTPIPSAAFLALTGWNSGVTTMMRGDGWIVLLSCIIIPILLLLPLRDILHRLVVGYVVIIITTFIWVNTCTSEMCGFALIYAFPYALFFSLLAALLRFHKRIPARVLIIILIAAGCILQYRWAAKAIERQTTHLRQEAARTGKYQDAASMQTACTQIDNTMQRNQCIQGLATKEKNPDICEAATSWDYEDCVYIVFRDGIQPEVCGTKENPTYESCVAAESKKYMREQGWQGEMQTSKKKPSITQDAITYFNEVGFLSDPESTKLIVTKWVNVGALIFAREFPEEADLRCVQDAIQELNRVGMRTRLLHPEGTMADDTPEKWEDRKWSEKYAADMSFQLMPRQEHGISLDYFSSEEDLQHVKDVAGIGPKVERGLITQAIIAIDRRSSLEERCTQFRKQILEAFGLHATGTSHPESLLNVTIPNEGTFASIDLEVLQMLYQPSILPGDTPEALPQK